MKPFSVTISEEEIQELKLRLSLSRLPDEMPDAAWEYGIPLGLMREILHEWKVKFDWRAVEDRINSHSNYKATIDGMDIHFVHERGEGENPLPLLIPHGWPGSFYEMLDLIPYLTHPSRFGGDPSDAFDVVIPSIPGHGFSSVPSQKGFEDRQAAELLVKLMNKLGYDRFGAHGYDLGASILGLLCLDHPEQVIGYHTTSPGNPSPYLADDAAMTDAERRYIELCKQWYKEEAGYAHLLGTKPQTLAYAFNDSPLGLAAFILEKWYLWTAPPNGDLFRHFDRQTMLTNVSIYWFTQTINASNRFYYEGRHTRWPGENEVSSVPLGVSLTATQAHERPPREYVERLFPDIRSWEELGEGGHFVATENPRLIAEHIRRFFRKLR
ncbi:epoxide hydrolase family protein [Paenibacillus sp. NPDC058071]|uniref:epoxide hydrolase family protein n=1 Tax=Paenibacillus sp. NPDC058071 TaxID=3346326 RepID=UPI0036DF00C0